MTSERHPGNVGDGRWLRATRATAALILCAATTLVLAGCASTPPEDAAREYLDPQTAATVTVSGRPLVFALERPNLAVHARDYLTLVSIDVNRAGAHQQYFYAYLWSTIDKRRTGQHEPAAQRFELVADGRRIALTPVPGTLRGIGLGAAPLPPPTAAAEVLVSATTREAQQFVAQADEVVVVASGDHATDRFALWDR